MLNHTALRIALPFALLAFAAGCDDGRDLGDLLDDEPDLSDNDNDNADDNNDDDGYSVGGDVDDNGNTSADADFSRVTHADGSLTTDYDVGDESCSVTYYFEFVPAAEPSGCTECDYTFMADLNHAYSDCSFDTGGDITGLAWGIDLDGERLFFRQDGSWYLNAEGFTSNHGYQIDFQGSSGWVDAGDYSWRDTFSLSVQ